MVVTWLKACLEVYYLSKKKKKSLFRSILVYYASCVFGIQTIEFRALHAYRHGGVSLGRISVLLISLFTMNLANVIILYNSRHA